MRLFETTMNVKTIEQRAQEYASSGEYSPSITEAYKAGAEEEHRLLTEWHDVSEEPDANGLYLVALTSKNNAPKIYSVAAYLGEGCWFFDGYYHHTKPSFDEWRPIHE